LKPRTAIDKFYWIKLSCKSLALGLVLVTTLSAAGEMRQEKTFDSTREPRISLVNIKGQILIRGWDKAQVHVVYTVPSPRAEVDTVIFPETGPADKVHFSIHELDTTGEANEAAIDYTLDVPTGSRLEIRNPQGQIRVEGIQGDASLESVGGDILVADYSGHLFVRSVGGNIEVRRPSGHVEVSSITGNLHFVSPTAVKLRGSTTSGHIIFEGDFMDRGDYILSAYSGDVDVVCPPTASYELSAKTVKGKVINTLPMTHRHRSASPQSSANSLLGTYNTGKATVELTSFSGTIRIRPQE
jgi:DUF4097 and DUF4098 domain-containing protein YvlB